MAVLKLFLFTVFLSLIVGRIAADAGLSSSDTDGVSRSDGHESDVIEQFKSKIHALESLIDEKARETKLKDEVIAAKEKIIKKKLDRIASLEREISSLRKKGKLDVAEQIGKAHAKAEELEKEVEKLKINIALRNKKKDLVETRSAEVEKKASELNSKVENEEMMKAKFEATSKTKELMEARGAWFSPWLAEYLIQYQLLLEKNWQLHGKPAMEMMAQKAIEKKTQAGELAAPHVETIKTKWVPAIKEQWVVISTNVEPHVKSLTEKTIDIYAASKRAITHVIKVQEIMDPYFQELNKFSKPYIDQAVTATRPYVDKVQDTVQEKLKSHKLTKPLATKEFIWFLASTLLGQWPDPSFFCGNDVQPYSAIRGGSLFTMVSLNIHVGSFDCSNKGRKPVCNGNSKHSRRKAKRGRSDE